MFINLKQIFVTSFLLSCANTISYSFDSNEVLGDFAIDADHICNDWIDVSEGKEDGLGTIHDLDAWIAEEIKAVSQKLAQRPPLLAPAALQCPFLEKQQTNGSVNGKKRRGPSKEKKLDFETDSDSYKNKHLASSNASQSLMSEFEKTMTLWERNVSVSPLLSTEERVALINRAHDGDLASQKEVVRRVLEDTLHLWSGADKEKVLSWDSLDIEYQDDYFASFILNLSYKPLLDKYPDIFNSVRTRAKQGFALAQKNYGRMYRFGWGVKKNCAKAIKWFERGFRQNCSHSTNNLGMIYNSGDHGVEVNKELAVEFFTIATQQGNLFALRNLGICYRDGEGVKINEKIAQRCCDAATKKRGYV